MDQGPDRLVELVPAGADLDLVRDLVRDDLPADADLVDLLGTDWERELPLGARPDLPRIRPILVALAARAAGASSAIEGEPLYAAELLHLALVVHDLALGKQGGRRRRVARRVVRRSVSWLGGNHLTLRALELCRHSSPEILGELVDTLREISDGQSLARELQQGRPPSAQDWREHADAQTGALFAFCCRVGGHLARAEAPVVTALGRYGRHVGRLWHVAEDLAVLEHGEGAAHLIARAGAGRPVLVVIAAAERDPRVAVAWARLVSDPVDADAAALLARVRELGRGPAREVMARESWAARRALRTLPESRYRATMERLAARLVSG